VSRTIIPILAVPPQCREKPTARITLTSPSPPTRAYQEASRQPTLLRCISNESIFSPLHPNRTLNIVLRSQRERPSRLPPTQNFAGRSAARVRQEHTCLSVYILRSCRQGRQAGRQKRCRRCAVKQNNPKHARQLLAEPGGAKTQLITPVHLQSPPPSSAALALPMPK